MRIDGKFEGEIISTGNIIVGRTGKLTGDFKGPKVLLVEGEVRSFGFFWFYVFAPCSVFIFQCKIRAFCDLLAY